VGVSITRAAVSGYPLLRFRAADRGALSLCNGGGMAYASITTRQLLAVLRIWRSLRLFGIFLCRCLSGPTPAFIRPGPQPWLELAVCAGGRWRVTAAG